MYVADIRNSGNRPFLGGIQNDHAYPFYVGVAGRRGVQNSPGDVARRSGDKTGLGVSKSPGDVALGAVKNADESTGRVRDGKSVLSTIQYKVLTCDKMKQFTFTIPEQGNFEVREVLVKGTRRYWGNFTRIIEPLSCGHGGRVDILLVDILLTN